jgi:hypothetical protein
MFKQALCSWILFLGLLFNGCDRVPVSHIPDEEYFQEMPYAGVAPFEFFALGDIGFGGKMFHFSDSSKHYFLHPRWYKANFAKGNAACFTDYYTYYIETDIVVEAQSLIGAPGNYFNSCNSSNRSYQMFTDFQISGSGEYSNVRVGTYGWFHTTNCVTLATWDEIYDYSNVTFSPTAWYGGLACDETVSDLDMIKDVCNSSYNITHAYYLRNDDASKSLTITRTMLSCYSYNP